MRLPAPAMPEWLEHSLPFDRYSIRVGEYRMHVMETGDGKPVLMLHGNPTWGYLYRKVAARLTGAGRLVMPDLIGLGFSDKPDTDKAHTLEAHATWLGNLVDALDLRDVILVVQDWGGPIGLRAFADRKERLRGLVIMNTVVGPPRPGFRQTSFHRLARLPVASDIVFRVFGFPQNALHLAQGDRNSIRGEVARAYRLPLKRGRGRRTPLALARMVPNSMRHPSIAPLQRCQELVESFDGPTAIVWGDRDPVLGRVRHHLERLMPRATITVTQAGHFLQEEVPDEIAAAIRDVRQRAHPS